MDLKENVSAGWKTHTKNADVFLGQTCNTAISWWISWADVRYIWNCRAIVQRSMTA